MLRATPTAKIRASDVLQLPRYDGNVLSTLDVLADAGLLIEDRPSRVELYFARKAADLPPLMHEHLELLLQAVLKGSQTPPRQVPRDPDTVRTYILGVISVVNTWVAAGSTTFAEVTHADVLAALPDAGGRRQAVVLGLQSLFRLLKGRRLVFVNPVRNVKVGPMPHNIPLGLDPEVICGELNSPNPAVALAVALVAFHALTGNSYGT